MSTTGLERFNKKFGSAVKRTKKEAKKAAEGHMLKEMADKKKANESFFDKADRYIKENNIVVPEDEQYTIMTVSFLNKMEQDMRANITAELKSNMEKDEEEMNAEQMKAIVAETIEAMTSNRAKELELELKLQEARNKELEMKMALATLELKLILAREEEEDEEAIAKAQVEKQFAPKKEIKRRKGVSKKNKVEEINVEEVINPLEGKLEEVEEPTIFATPVRKGRGGYSVAWKTVITQGTFLDTVINIVEYAAEQGVDVADTNAFRKFSPVCQGAYIQYTKLYSNGSKGCWQEFINQYALV